MVVVARGESEKDTSESLIYDIRVMAQSMHPLEYSRIPRQTLLSSCLILSHLLYM